jgi:hypothetical protein
MRFDFWKSVQLLAACLLLALCATGILAQTHVVSPSDIHKELVNTAQTRQKNLEKTSRLFSSDETRKAMEAAKMSSEKVDAAISTLSDDELARSRLRRREAERQRPADRHPGSRGSRPDHCRSALMCFTAFRPFHLSLRRILHP